MHNKKILTANQGSENHRDEQGLEKNRASEQWNYQPEHGYQTTYFCHAQKEHFFNCN